MARRQVSIFINGREVANNIKSIAAEKRKVTRELNNMTRGSAAYNAKVKELDRLNGIIGDHRKKIRGVESAWDKLSKGAGKFIGLAGIAITADAIVDYGKEIFNLGAEMQALTRKAETVFGTALPLVTQAAQENATAMGLTISQYTDAAAAIGDLLIPMGFQREEAANISTQLVDLSGALSEWSGGQKSAEQVTEALSKALLGEREQLKTLGISIKEADVQARLAEKGLEKLTGTLLEQAKATATLEIIMEKSVDAQEAYAKNTDLSVRKQAELRAQLTQITEVIATNLVPVFGRLLDIANSFLGWVNEYLETPWEDEMIKEQNELNVLVSRITDASLSQEGRNKLIDELQKKYPNFLGNLNAETVTNEELASRLGEVNNQYIFKIALQKEDEKVEAQVKKAAEARRTLAEREIKTQEELLALNQKYKLDLDFTNLSLQERIDLVERRIRQTAFTDNELENIKVQKDLQRILFRGVEVSKEKTAAEEKELSVLQRKREELKKNLEAQLGINKADLEQKPTQAAGNEQNLKDAADEERRKKEAEKRAKEREKEAERELKDLEKRFEKLQEMADSFATDARLKALSEEDRKREKLAMKFDLQIEEAKALEAQGVAEATTQRLELERLKDQALRALEEELNQKRHEENMTKAQEQTDVEIEQSLANIKRQADAEREIKAFLKEEDELTLEEERAQALLDLEQQLFEMSNLAEQHGIDTVAITEKYRKKKEKIEKDFDKKDKDQRIKTQKEQAEALVAAFNGAGNAIKETYELLAAVGAENTAFGKILALAHIAIESAKAIASAVASSAGVPYPGNLVAMASAVGVVLGNIAQAKNILSGAKVPQKKLGGYTDVIGQDDGLTYRAQYIGSPQSGMLPNRPVVLASEAGREYFVSNKDLQNPAIANYVQMIDNISRSRRVPQFQDGGFNDAGARAVSDNGTTIDVREVNNQLLNEISRLNAILESGIFARVDDVGAEQINKKINDLNTASGGVLNTLS